MLATLRETWTSISNLNYGQEIIQKTVGQAFWYWCKYVLAISILLFFLALGALVYFVPQLPQLADKNIPDIRFDLKDGKLTTDAPQPLTLGDKTFMVIINTEGKESDLDQIEDGALILEDRVIFKDKSRNHVIWHSDLEDFSFDKPVLINWLKTHKLLMLTGGLVVALVAGLFLLGFFIVARWVTFLIAGLVLFIMGKVLKKPLTFRDSLKLVLYAAVPSLLVSLIFTLLASDIGWTISHLVWIFFACGWLIKLPVAKSQ